jgi:hypothetical protein
VERNHHDVCGHQELTRLIAKDRHRDKVIYNFNRAWLHHQNVNPHHWQYFVFLNDFGNPETCIEMPERYMLEMIADWRGVSRVKHKNHTDEQVLSEVRAFYQNTTRYRKLHDITKMKVEGLLDVEVPSIELLQDPAYKDGEPPITSGWQQAPMEELSDALRGYHQDLLQNRSDAS